MPSATRRVDTATLRMLAVRASADPRSVARVLRGERVAGMADARIRAVLIELGLMPHTGSPLAVSAVGGPVGGPLAGKGPSF